MKSFVSQAKPLVKLSRPWEWPKNVFLLAPLLFGGKIAILEAVVTALWAMAAFCLWSSAVYSLNDVLDASSDRIHPRKKNRPVASGAIAPQIALLWSLGLAVVGFALAAFLTPLGVAGLGGLYLFNSLLYARFLKKFAILDILIIAIGFVIRLLAGCSAINVQPSDWLLVCGFALALLLGFGKRRLELENLDQPQNFRAALQAYSPEKLNLMLGVSASVCLLSYMLYAVSPQTVALHQTNRLVFTVPFVAYGIFRYLSQVQDGRADGPVDLFLKDPAFMLNGFLWALCSGVILYAAK